MEVQEWMAKAEATDREPVPEGLHKRRVKTAKSGVVLGKSQPNR